MGRILIVDDESPIAEGLGALFEIEQIPAATASDREAAEQLLCEEHFAVVLADLRLRTEEEGLRLLESIRRLSPRSRVATMTGFATPAIEEQLRALGVRQVVYKPVEFPELLAVVRSLLGEDDPGTAPEEVDLDALYEEVRAVLYSLPMRRFRLASEDAEDIVQQAWCLLLEKRQFIRRPRAWLSGTVANLCRQRLEERQRLVPAAPEELDAVADSRSRCADAVLSIRAALDAADDRTRQLCTMIGLQELTYEEVSVRLAIPLGSVGPCYIRAKAKLRKLLVAA